MNRTRSLSALIHLPRMNMLLATSVAIALQAAAAADPQLSLMLARALKDLKAAQQALQAFMVRRQFADRKRGRVKKAYQEIRAAWRSFYLFLKGITELPESKGGANVARAKHIYGKLFGNGLSFLGASAPLVWAPSSTRLRGLVEDHQDAVEAMGGGFVLQVLREVHDEYGKIVGITAPLVREEKEESGLDLLRNLLDQIRIYILQVHAWAEFAPENRARAQMLLKPIQELIEDRKRSKPTKKNETKEGPVVGSRPEPEAKLPETKPTRTVPSENGEDRVVSSGLASEAKATKTVPSENGEDRVVSPRLASETQGTTTASSGVHAVLVASVPASETKPDQSVACNVGPASIASSTVTSETQGASSGVHAVLVASVPASETKPDQSVACNVEPASIASSTVTSETQGASSGAYAVPVASSVPASQTKPDVTVSPGGESRPAASSALRTDL